MVEVEQSWLEGEHFVQDCRGPLPASLPFRNYCHDGSVEAVALKWRVSAAILGGLEQWLAGGPLGRCRNWGPLTSFPPPQLHSAVWPVWP